MLVLASSSGGQFYPFSEGARNMNLMQKHPGLPVFRPHHSQAAGSAKAGLPSLEGQPRTYPQGDSVMSSVVLDPLKNCQLCSEDVYKSFSKIPDTAGTLENTNF